MLRRAIHPVRRRPATTTTASAAVAPLLHGSAKRGYTTNAAASSSVVCESSVCSSSSTAAAAPAHHHGFLSTTRLNRQRMGSGGMGGPIPGMPNMGGGAPGLHGAPTNGQPQSPYGIEVPPLPGFDGQPIDMGNVVHLEAKRRREMGGHISAKFVVEKDTSPVTGRVIGIDLGTTNSCVSYIDKETLKPKIIPSPTGSWVFPTAITFDKGHQVRVFGEEARACARTSASSTLCSGKRLIGRRFGELGNIQTQMSKTNTLTITEKGEVAVEIMGRTYSVVHITAMFLRYLKKEAEKFLNEPVTRVVVSVPAYFTPQQKIATEDAALSAGFDVLEVIDEPSAACLTYTVLNGGAGEDKVLEADSPQLLKMKADAAATAAAAKTKKDANKTLKRSLVFDLGGGTLDCALMEHDTAKETFTLVATHGDPMLGGNDWDAVLSNHMARNFEKKWRIEIEDPDGNAAQGVGDNRNLLLEAERCKIHFTHSMEVYNGYQRGFHFSAKLRDIIPLEVTMTFEEYLALTRPLRERCLACLQKLFEHTTVKPSEVDHILLVGAMTRDPPIKRLLTDFFGREPEEEKVCPADYAVAIGAAIRGGMLEGLYPDLTANTRFVKGTQQSRHNASLVERALDRVTTALNPLRWGRAHSYDNPNAIGHRWRGVVKGLTDEEIMNYAKEMVEFEAAQHRRELLERAEDEANRLMGRVARDSSRRQGMQEKRVKQLSDQLKFWQYMVHNFHDHEEELQRTVRELEECLNELEGGAKNGDEEGTKDADKFTAEGTIKFGATNNNNGSTATAPSGSTSPFGGVIKAKTINRGKASASAAAGATASPAVAQQLGTNATTASTEVNPAFVTARNPGGVLPDAADKVSYTAEELGEGEGEGGEEGGGNHEGGGGGGAPAAAAAPKILRRDVPLSPKSSGVNDLIEAGHAAFMNSPVPIPEKTRSALFRSTVEERAWHEPPAPPGETGSWTEVKKAMEEGLDVGLPVPVDELVRPMSCEEMLEVLREHYPLDNFISPQHAEEFALSCLAAEMVEGVSPGIEAFMAATEKEREAAAESGAGSTGSVRVGTA